MIIVKIEMRIRKEEREKKKSFVKKEGNGGTPLRIIVYTIF
jgi:hypothetical protein